MDPVITAEWLLSFDSDYEPSGLMTPRDRAELERRKAERLSESRRTDESNTENTERAYSLETAATASP
jgi:uncharacterized protein YbbK (DUF523 family)